MFMGLNMVSMYFINIMTYHFKQNGLNFPH